MKKTKKNLKLAAESLRNLTADQAVIVRGGFQSAGGNGNPCDSKCSCQGAAENSCS